MCVYIYEINAQQYTTCPDVGVCIYLYIIWLNTGFA